jgi:hypothetical protein
MRRTGQRSGRRRTTHHPRQHAGCGRRCRERGDCAPRRSAVVAHLDLHACGSPKTYRVVSNSSGHSNRLSTSTLTRRRNWISERRMRADTADAGHGHCGVVRRGPTRPDGRSGDASRRLPASPRSDRRLKTPAGDQGHLCPRRGACGFDGNTRDTREGCGADAGD